MNNGNMPAAPVDQNDLDCIKRFYGLTKREHYAGLAMQGFIINPPKFNAGDIIKKLELPSSTSTNQAFHYTNQMIARLSLDKADALLKELDK